MIDGKFRVERKYKNKKIIIDLAELPGGAYEAIAMYKLDGLDFDCFRSRDYDEAINAFNQMVEKYPADPEKKRVEKRLEEKPMSGKYAKLRDDLKVALAAGQEVEKSNPEDGGTCNFDSTALCLPRWRYAEIKRAAEEAGTHCFKWNLYGTIHYVFSPITKGQGNARSRNAETVTLTMKSLGYDAMDYCQAD